MFLKKTPYPAIEGGVLFFSDKPFELKEEQDGKKCNEIHNTVCDDWNHDQST